MSTRIMKKFENVSAGIENMLAAAIHHYNQNNFNEKMKEEFANSFMTKQGQKYIKIGTKNIATGEMGSVWGFVVNTDNDVKFKKGDVLKPAGFNAPARNGARGNVLEGGFSINWTGPLYLV